MESSHLDSAFRCHDAEFQFNLKPGCFAHDSGQTPSIVSEHPSEKTKAPAVMQHCSVRSGSIHRGLAAETFVFLTVNLLYPVQVFLAENRFQNVALCEKKREDRFHLDTNTGCKSVLT